MLPKYNDIVELLKKGATIEAQEKITELREAALELQDENHELRNKIKLLEEKLSIEEQVEWDKPHYWLENGDSRDGPFCQRCYDADAKLIRLQDGKNDTWHCKECKNTFRGPDYEPPRFDPPTGHVV